MQIVMDVPSDEGLISMPDVSDFSYPRHHA